ncbi:hypothetical protein P5V15_005851 [Pogonomyrmex californicus]
MRSFFGDKASEEILRVKWLSLLPPNAQCFLKIFSAPNLNELVIAADHLLEGSSSSYVMSTSHPTRSLSPARRSQTALSSLALQQVSLTLAVKSLLACAASAIIIGDSVLRLSDAPHFAHLRPAAVDSSNNSAIALPSKELRVYDRTTNIKFLIDSCSAVSVVPKRLIAKPLKPSDAQTARLLTLSARRS